MRWYSLQNSMRYDEDRNKGIIKLIYLERSFNQNQKMKFITFFANYFIFKTPKDCQCILHLT